MTFIYIFYVKCILNIMIIIILKHYTFESYSMFILLSILKEI